MESKLSLTSVFSYFFGVGVLFVFSFFIFNIFKLGYSQLDLNFLLSSPSNMGRSGGIFSVIISTMVIMSIALLCVVPIGLLTAIKLSELNLKNKYVNLTRGSLHILAGVPSVVFGLFGALFFGELLGLGYSLLTGGFTLACMVLPLFISTVEQGIRAVPMSIKFSARSLGLSNFTYIFKVILPMALPSVVAAVTLSVGRAMAETAALLFTSGYSYRMPDSLLDSGRSLSVHIYELAMNVPGGDTKAFQTAFVLLFLIGAINIASKFVTQFVIRRGV